MDEGNVVFTVCNVRSRVRNGKRVFQIDMRFRLSSELADLIRECSRRPPEDLDSRLRRNPPGKNSFEYGVVIADPGLVIKSVERIEDIGNQKDAKYILEHLLTDRGRSVSPSEVHRIITEESGITSEEEWFVALFFISLSKLIWTIGDQED